MAVERLLSGHIEATQLTLHMHSHLLTARQRPEFTDAAAMASCMQSRAMPCLATGSATRSAQRSVSCKAAQLGPRMDRRYGAREVCRAMQMEVDDRIAYSATACYRISSSEGGHMRLDTESCRCQDLVSSNISSIASCRSAIGGLLGAGLLMTAPAALAKDLEAAAKA